MHIYRLGQKISDWGDLMKMRFEGHQAVRESLIAQARDEGANDAEIRCLTHQLEDFFYNLLDHEEFPSLAGVKAQLAEEEQAWKNATDAGNELTVGKENSEPNWTGDPFFDQDDDQPDNDEPEDLNPNLHIQGTNVGGDPGGLMIYDS